MSENEFVGFGVFGCDFKDMQEAKKFWEMGEVLTAAGRRVQDELNKVNAEVAEIQAPLKLKIKQLQNENDQLRLSNSAAWEAHQKLYVKTRKERDEALADVKELEKIYEAFIFEWDNR
jgi:hypothetical protein